MFTIPDGPHHVNIIGIDPGTHLLGLGFLTYDVVTEKIVKTSAVTVVVDRLAINTMSAQIHGLLFAKIEALRYFLINIFLMHEPIAVFSECPYFNGGTPSAFGPLVKTLETVKGALTAYDNVMPLTEISPSAIKKAIGASGGAKKGPVRQKMREKLNYICFQGDFDSLGDDAVDSLATVVTGFEQMVDRI